MTRPIPPLSHRDPAATATGPGGPVNDAERRLQQLVMDGINSGPGRHYDDVEQLAAELRDRLKNRRR